MLTLTPSPTGVPVVPNSSLVTAEVVSIKMLSTTWAVVEARILTSQDVAGLRNLTRDKVGEVVRLLAEAEEVQALGEGSQFEAEVALRGDERGADFYVQGIKAVVAAPMPLRPNDSLITARILAVTSYKPGSLASPMWQLEIQLLTSRNVSNLPNLTRDRIGQSLMVLTREAVDQFRVGTTIQARVSLRGEQAGLAYYASSIQKVEP